MAKNSEKYAYLNRLSTEQLEELLRMDAEEARPGNEDVVFHILEVIEQRENEHPTGRVPDVDKAWAEFQEYYDIPEGPMRLCTPTKLSLMVMPIVRPSYLHLTNLVYAGVSNRHLLPWSP